MTIAQWYWSKWQMVKTELQIRPSISKHIFSNLFSTQSCLGDKSSFRLLSEFISLPIHRSNYTTFWNKTGNNPSTCMSQKFSTWCPPMCWFELLPQKTMHGQTQTLLSFLIRRKVIYSGFLCTTHEGQIMLNKCPDPLSKAWQSLTRPLMLRWHLHSHVNPISPQSYLQYNKFHAELSSDFCVSLLYILFRVTTLQNWIRIYYISVWQ